MGSASSGINITCEAEAANQEGKSDLVYGLVACIGLFVVLLCVLF